MKRFVIFTAIIGNYDDIMQPSVIDGRFDYVLFSNSCIEERVGVWEVHKIPYNNTDNTRVARWIKTHPEELLREYDASVWLDGRISISSSCFYDRIEELFETGTQFAALVHPERQCIYDEIIEVILLQLDREDVCIRWWQQLKKENYPVNNHLFETGVLFRNHTFNKVTTADRLWWSCIQQFSRRDQLSFNYILWKLNIECKAICNDNVRNSQMFCVNNHTTAHSRQILVKPSPLLAYFVHHPNHNKGKEYYGKVLNKKHPRVWAFYYAFVLRLKQLVRML